MACFVNNAHHTVTLIIDGLLEAVFVDEETVDNLFDSEDLIDLESHQIPSSADFSFFYSIAATVPSFSPGDESESFQNIMSPPTNLLDSQVSSQELNQLMESQESVSSQELSGVPLLPLTQICLRTQLPAHGSSFQPGGVPSNLPEIETLPSVSNYLPSENVTVFPPDKRIKLCSYLSSNDDQTVPLTMDSKLNLTADIFPAGSCMLNESNCGSSIKDSSAEEETMPNHLHIEMIKKEVEDPVEVPDTNNNVTKELMDENVEESSLYDVEDVEKKTDYQPLVTVRSQIWSLLHRPPRLGLSKLDRRVGGLHDVTIVDII